MKAVPYLRTSTDDKGQDPDRQLDVIKRWAAGQGVELLVAVEDDGTSGWKFGPFERGAFQRAVDIAKLYKAEAIVVEQVDRFSRQGVEELYRASLRLKDEYGLQIWWADTPLELQRGMAGHLLLAVKAHAANEWVMAHSERVKSGMAKLKASGKRMGRPVKPFPEHEVQLAASLRGQGLGWEKIAMEINRRRGVFELASPRAQRAAKTSAPAVRRAVLALRNPEPTKVDSTYVGVA